MMVRDADEDAYMDTYLCRCPVKSYLQAQDTDEDLVDDGANRVPGHQCANGINGVPERI